MAIIIQERNGSTVATLDYVLSCKVTEKLSTVKTLSFETLHRDELTTLTDEGQYLAVFDGELYDIVKIKKDFNGGFPKIAIDCEPVSYRLSDVSLEAQTLTGTPRQILDALLTDTDFHSETVEPTTGTTFELTKTMTVRAAILNFCESRGWDVLFSQYGVSVLAHRGCTAPKTLVQRNALFVTKSIDKENGTRGYTCALREPTDIAIGDIVHFQFNELGIDENVRVVGLTKEPFTSKEISLSVETDTAGLENQWAGLSSDVSEQGERLEEIEDSKMYRLTILSSNGNIFKNGQISTVLSAVVNSWDEDVTDDLDANQFIWTRVSDDADEDILWNQAHAGGTKSITITGADVHVRATFYCDLIDTTTRASLL